MPLPKKEFHGTATISMMELRKAPGDILDRVANGLKVVVEKNGKKIAVLSPFVPCDNINEDCDPAEPELRPLTFRQNLGGYY